MTPQERIAAFITWLTEHGATVEVIQPDDGSGYVCVTVDAPPIADQINLTIGGAE